MLQATADLVLLKSRKGNIEDSIHWQTWNIPGPIKVQGENRCRGFKGCDSNTGDILYFLKHKK